jgi:hypothetical protein
MPDRVLRLLFHETGAREERRTGLKYSAKSRSWRVCGASAAKLICARTTYAVHIIRAVCGGEGVTGEARATW